MAGAAGAGALRGTVAMGAALAGAGGAGVLAASTVRILFNRIIGLEENGQNLTVRDI